MFIIIIKLYYGHAYGMLHFTATTRNTAYIVDHIVFVAVRDKVSKLSVTTILIIILW